MSAVRPRGRRPKRLGEYVAGADPVRGDYIDNTSIAHTSFDVIDPQPRDCNPCAAIVLDVAPVVTARGAVPVIAAPVAVPPIAWDATDG